MRFALIAHPDSSTTNPSLKRVLNWCNKNDVVCVGRRSLFEMADIPSRESCQAVESDFMAAESADIAIVIGGDGTILRTAQLVRTTRTPILGINRGRLGFMANIHEDQIEESLDLVLRREYRIDRRFMLEARPNNGQSHFALNEFLFTKKDTTSLITIIAHYGEQFVNRYWADGLIVATPTGSTAYNLSSGGPIVMPGTPVMVITPINPHTLTTRPLVLPAGKKLKIRVEEEGEHTLMSNDGRIMEIPRDPFDVEIFRSDSVIELIQLPEQNYFDTLRAKLMWGMDSRM